MNIFLTIAIALANIISVVTVYQFVKRLDKKQMVIFIAISVGIMYMLISAIYWLSGIGVDARLHESSKNFVLYLFVPVNVLLFVPYFASKYMKLKENQIKRTDFVKTIEKLAILLVVISALEFFYFRNIQTNIANIQEQANVIVNQ